MGNKNTYNIMYSVQLYTVQTASFKKFWTGQKKSKKFGSFNVKGGGYPQLKVSITG